MYTTPGTGKILIDQVGSRNYAKQDFSGKNLSGKVYQTGDWNESRQTIDGQMDEAFVEIDGDRNYTRQTIDGGWNGNGSPSNLSEVYIDGDWNDVRTTQEGSFNSTRVDINGDVYGHEGKASRNDVDVDQIGDYNYLKYTIPRGDIAGDYNDLK
ncbi:MAG: hypothetical protein U5L09_12600 [Bacteroidales bacterium]|nr:hypothetical protein [Bacteroidales bacterium]